MTDADPRIDPTEVRNQRFPGSARRYEARAVDQFLRSLEERIRATNRLVDTLRAQVAADPAAGGDPEGVAPMGGAAELGLLDDEELVRLVGEETASVLRTARRAAEDIRTKAEESASRVIREATTEAKTVVDEARAEGARLRAEAEAERSHSVARAEEAAAGVRLEADRAAERVRIEAEDVLREANEEAGSVRDAARHDAEQAIEEARAQARAEVEAAAALRDEARADAARIKDDAREEGRQMVTEARQVRSRVLEDLQRRRDAARAQVEILLDGRDRLLVAYARVRAGLDDVTTLLGEVVPAADQPEIPVPELDELRTGSQPTAAPAAVAGATDDADPEPDVEPETDQAPDDTRAPAGTEGSAAPRPPVDGEVDALFARLRGVAEPEEAAAGADADAVDSKGSGDDGTVDDGTVDDGGLDDGGLDDGALDDGATERVPEEFLAPSPSLAARAETLDPLRASLSRALKRRLADEQNEVLDQIRRTESTDIADLYPAFEAHVAAYAGVAGPALAAAAEGGARSVGPDEVPSSLDADELARLLAENLVEPFRRRAERAAEDVGDSADELDERLRALYREWKVTVIGQAVDDALLGAYARGTLDAAAPGVGLRWFVDPDQGPCPDAQDNALEGVVAAGDAFPTGDPCPQAHPGCRCLVVVETA